MELRKLSAFYLGMEGPEPSWSYGQRDTDVESDMKGDKAGDDENWEGSKKRNYQSGNPRKQNNAEVEEDSTERRKGSGDRKRPGASSRAVSGDEDDYDARKEMHSRQGRNNPEERPEKKSSGGCQDREAESNRKSRDVVATRGNWVFDEGERESLRKLSSKISWHESSQSMSRSKRDISHDGEMEKMTDRDFRYPERKESSRDKGLGSREPDRNPRRGGRGRLTGRDGQRVSMPMPMMGSPFAPLGLSPGLMQPLGPNMSPAPGPIGLGVFIQPFPGPNVWLGARGVDMNILAVPPGLSPVPSGPSSSRFPPNMVTGPNLGMYFAQPGPARGMSPGITGPGFNSMGTMGRVMPHERAPGGWTPRNNGPPGKAPSRGEQNDYSQNFVDTGTRPQNFIRELEPTSAVEDYPKLRELIQKKDEIVAKVATTPMYYKCDLREFVLSSEFFGTKFDVILVDPPWEEYVHRAPGVADHMEYWTFEEIMNLKIEAIADTPSFIFLWVGDGVGLEQGRQCLKKWGFRRCEDICWVKTNKMNATPGLQHDAHTLFQHSKEHCLMGIKGTVRRSTDGHIIHANIDTDIIIAEEPPYGSTMKPEDMYRIIEHFSLGRRRLELFGEDHNIRSGWLTVGKGLSSSNFNAEAYIRNFADKDGKVWQGGGGRNPPPEAPHLVLTTPDIEGLRPKSPPQKIQQQQQSTSFSTTANSTNRRPVGNSPQNHAIVCTSQEVTSLNSGILAQWAPPTGALKAPDVLTSPFSVA